MSDVQLRSDVCRSVLQASQSFGHLKSVIWEYVSNAIDSVDSGIKPIVTVHVSKDELVVEDNGKGMDLAGLNNFFTMHGENQDRKKGRSVISPTEPEDNLQPANEDFQDGIKIADNLNTLRKIEEVPFSVRSLNALIPSKVYKHPEDADITYIGELIQIWPANLLRRRSFGRKSLREVQSILENMGLRLNTKVLDWEESSIPEMREKYNNEIKELNEKDTKQLFSLLNIEGATIEDELDALVNSLNVKQERNKAIIKDFMGFDGSGRKTLEEVGRKNNLTRERIRQLNKKYFKKLNVDITYMPKTLGALKYIENIGPVSKGQLESQLKKEDFSKGIFDVTGLISLAELMEIKIGWRIFSIKGKLYVLSPQYAYDLKKVFSAARRLCSRNGFTSINDISQSLKDREKLILNEDEIQTYLSFYEGLIWLVAYENGKKKPSGDEILILSDFYKVPRQK